MLRGAGDVLGQQAMARVALGAHSGSIGLVARIVCTTLPRAAVPHAAAAVLSVRGVEVVALQRQALHVAARDDGDIATAPTVPAGRTLLGRAQRLKRVATVATVACTYTNSGFVHEFELAGPER